MTKNTVEIKDEVVAVETMDPMAENQNLKAENQALREEITRLTDKIAEMIKQNIDVTQSPEGETPSAIANEDPTTRNMPPALVAAGFIRTVPIQIPTITGYPKGIPQEGETLTIGKTNITVLLARLEHYLPSFRIRISEHDDTDSIKTIVEDLTIFQLRSFISECREFVSPGEDFPDERSKEEASCANDYYTNDTYCIMEDQLHYDEGYSTIDDKGYSSYDIRDGIGRAIEIQKSYEAKGLQSTITYNDCCGDRIWSVWYRK